MRKIFTVIPVVALLAVSAVGGQAEQMPGADGMKKQFEQMDRLMDEARKSRGADRWEHMHEHMQMMHDQMLAMHGMMGDGRPGMGMDSGGPMGRGPQEHGGQMDPGPDQWRRQMQNRMDMMQGMMEQMQKQQDLMLNKPTGPKR